MLQPPWTGVGALQNEVSDIQRQIRGKVDNHELVLLHSYVDRLEHSLREASSKIDSLEYRLQEMEVHIRELNPGLS